MRWKKNNFCSKSMVFAVSWLTSLIFVFILLGGQKKISNNLSHAQWTVSAHSNCVIWMRNKAFHTKTRSWRRRRQPQPQWRSETKARFGKKTDSCHCIFIFIRFRGRKSAYVRVQTHLCIYAIRNVFICWTNRAQFHLSIAYIQIPRSHHSACTLCTYKYQHRRNYGEMLLQNCIFVQLYSQISCNFHWVYT